MAKSATLQAEKRETARRKLVSYRAQCGVFDKMLDIIQNAESRLTSITAQYGESVSTGIAHDTMADQVIMLNDQIERMSGICASLGETLDEVLDLINGLIPIHPNAARILAKRYLEPSFEPTFGEIAAETGYSEDRVRHLHMEGLDLIAEKIFAAG